MKRLKVVLTICLSMALMFSLSGCSFVESWKTLMSTESTALTAEEIQQMKDAKVIRTVDESLEAPVFTLDLGPEVEYQLGTSADSLNVEATVSNGSVSYQWYYNNAQSNGGGTAIQGATESTYTPDISEKGTSYYFCVATNTVNGKIRMSTSQVTAVVVKDIEDIEILEAEEMDDTQASAASETGETEGSEGSAASETKETEETAE